MELFTDIVFMFIYFGEFRMRERVEQVVGFCMISKLV